MKAPIFKSALLIAVTTLFFSCQKDVAELSADNSLDSKAATVKVVQEHKFKGTYYDAWYWFAPGPGYVAGPAPGWYPGVGEGHATLIGKSTGFVNMFVSVGPNGLFGTPAPVNLFFAEELSELGITVPDAVTIIIFDKQGNSIWGSGVGTLPLTIESPTRVLFSGTLNIVGGTGKFAGATGHYKISGYFNPKDFNDAGIEILDGTIVY